MDVPVTGVPVKLPISSRFLRLGALALTVACALATSAVADEIRLKNGKKLYGVIVAFEDNMFKIKTEYGFELVEKDKIASIVPSTAAGEGDAKGEGQPGAKKGPTRPGNPPPTSEPALASGDDAAPNATNASAKSEPVEAAKREKSPAKNNNAGKADSPAKTAATAESAPPGKDSTPSSAALSSPPAPPKEEPPANREEIQGTSYTNYTHGFRMYKAPSWRVNEDARTALPNAIVAMGTFNESTLLVVGQEKTKEPLETAARMVEKRLHEAYDNYRIISQRKTIVGGQPAVEFHYRGLADGHDWSGTLVVISRGGDTLTVLGMTYADSDLIQIQENVIARSIASLDFSVH
jgi:hypothetical protein